PRVLLRQARRMPSVEERLMAKANPDDLRRLLEQCPPPGSHFRHYKGGEYVVVGAAILEASLEPAVLYRPMAGDGANVCWVRPLSVWNELIQHEGEQVRRF